MAFNGVGFIGTTLIGNKITNDKWSSYSYIRNDANFAFAGTKIYGFGGLNLAKFLGNKNWPETLGFGFQIGGGFKLTSKIAMQIQITQSTFDDDSKSSFKLNGIETSCSYTF